MRHLCWPNSNEPWVCTARCNGPLAPRGPAGVHQQVATTSTGSSRTTATRWPRSRRTFKGSRTRTRLSRRYARLGAPDGGHEEGEARPAGATGGRGAAGRGQGGGGLRQGLVWPRGACRCWRMGGSPRGQRLLGQHSRTARRVVCRTHLPCTTLCVNLQDVAAAKEHRDRIREEAQRAQARHAAAEAERRAKEAEVQDMKASSKGRARTAGRADGKVICRTAHCVCQLPCPGSAHRRAELLLKGGLGLCTRQMVL